jgi:flagellar biosynthesis/type III secretory pathway chaperone
MNAPVDHSLDSLAAALAEERRALLDHDVEALVRSTHEKLDALRRVEQAVKGEDVERLAPRLAELAESNHANGALLARRRREVNWTLRHLGRSESAGAYDIHGQTSTLNATRALGVG